MELQANFSVCPPTKAYRLLSVDRSRKANKRTWFFNKEKWPTLFRRFSIWTSSANGPPHIICKFREMKPILFAENKNLRFDDFAKWTLNEKSVLRCYNAEVMLAPRFQIALMHYCFTPHIYKKNFAISELENSSAMFISKNTNFSQHVSPFPYRTSAIRRSSIVFFTTANLEV